jgi:hypothetical protein
MYPTFLSLFLKLIFYSISLGIYVYGAIRYSKYPKAINAKGLIPQIFGGGVLLFSFMFKLGADFILSGGDFFTSFAEPPDVSRRVFRFFVHDLFEIFHILGIILLAYGIGKMGSVCKS